MEVVLDLIEYMQGRGNVWCARLDTVYGHVKQLIASGGW
jgi:hypothetical protein